MGVWKSKLHAQFHSRILQRNEEFLFWVLHGCSKCWTILDFLTQSCSLPLQDAADPWLLVSSLFTCLASKSPSHNSPCSHQGLEEMLSSAEDLVKKLVKSPLAQCNASNQLKSVLPKWEKLIWTKKNASAAVETASSVSSILFILACLSEKNFFATLQI